MMSRKRLLNMTSRKKQDTMAPYTNVTPGSANGNTNYGTGGAVLEGTTLYVMPFCATARPGTGSNGVQGSPLDNAMRTSTTCFMRGLKENIEVITNNGRAWQWRRICFTLRGEFLTGAVSTGYRLDTLTGNGNVRLLNSWGNGFTDAHLASLADILFKGTQLTDWTDPFTAPVDTKRVGLKYDRTRIIQSGNEQGVLRKFKIWHPMNKNLVYADEENGDDEITNKYSVDAKPGMGDYFVVDIIKAGLGGTTTDRMAFTPQASLYWHEK